MTKTGKTLLVGLGVLLVVVFPWNANAHTACSNASYALSIQASANRAKQALDNITSYRWSVASVRIRQAQALYQAAWVVKPCASMLKIAHVQYGIALDYMESGIADIRRGRFDDALFQIKRGSAWMARAIKTLRRFNSQ